MHFKPFDFPWLLLEHLLQKGRDCGFLFLYPQCVTLSTYFLTYCLCILMTLRFLCLPKPSPMYSFACRSFFFNDFIFQSSFRYTAKLSRRYKDFPYIVPYSCITSPIINIFHQSDTFVTTDVPTLTHYHPKSMFTLWFTFGVVYYEFWQMYNNVYPQS